MCDYSLAGIPNRLAAEGEQLVAYRFSTRAIGLTSPACHIRSIPCPILESQPPMSRGVMPSVPFPWATMRSPSSRHRGERPCS